MAENETVTEYVFLCWFGGVQ